MSEDLKANAPANAEADAAAAPAAAPEAKADEAFGHLKANEPQKIYILKGNQTALVGAENYLRKRGWKVETSTNLKLALIQIIQMRPDFVFISADNPHPKARIIPKVLVQVFPCFVIGFAESATRSSINNLELMGTQNTMVPPISGPKIERIVNKIIIELHSKPPDQRLKMAQGSSGAGGNTIAVKGGQSYDDNGPTGGGSSSDQARAAIQAMLAGGDDDTDVSGKGNDAPGIDPNFGGGSGDAAGSSAAMMKGSGAGGGPAYSGSAAGSAQGSGLAGSQNTFGQGGAGGTSGQAGSAGGPAYNGQKGQGQGGFGQGGMGSQGQGGFGQGGMGSQGQGGFGQGGMGSQGQGGFGQGGMGSQGQGGFGQGDAAPGAHGNSANGMGPLGPLGNQGYQEPLVGDQAGRQNQNSGDADGTNANGMGLKSQSGREATAGLHPHDELPETPGEAKYWDEISRKANQKKGAKPAPDSGDFADAFDEVGMGRAPLKARPRNDEDRKKHGERLQDWVKRRETSMQRRPQAREGKDIIITGNAGSAEQFKSVMDEGTYRSLQDSVVIQSPEGQTEFVKLGKSSNIACIVVESPKFSGYLVAAMGSDRQIDKEFMDTVRSKLKSFLKERGEEINEKETLDLSLQEVEFSDWALQQAEFLRKSVHKGDEIAMAFFPADTTQKELEQSKKEHMLMIEMDELKPDTAVEFDLYVYLPENDKYILYTPKGRKLGGAQKSRLSDKGVSQMHLRKESQADVKRYRVQNFLNDKIANYKLKKQATS